MIKQERLEFFGEKRLLRLHGSCLELLPICEALCCREWNIQLTRMEGKAGTYLADKVCLLTEKACEKDREDCDHLEYRLKKKTDRSCVYQDADDRCGIYDRRPRVCRDFSCQGGWRLDSAAGVDSGKKSAEFELAKDDFIAGLKADMTFVPHPLMKIHSILCIPAKGEVVFLKEFVGHCGKFYTKDGLTNPRWEERHLLGLLELFAQKHTLGEIHRRFSARTGIHVSQEEFHEIVWLFNKHQLILNCVHFAGLLRGIGGP